MQSWGAHSQPPLSLLFPEPGTARANIPKNAMLEYFPEQGSLSGDVSLSPSAPSCCRGLPNTSLLEGSLAPGDSRCHQLR